MGWEREAFLDAEDLMAKDAPNLRSECDKNPLSIVAVTASESVDRNHLKGESSKRRHQIADALSLSCYGPLEPDLTSPGRFRYIST